MITRWQNKLLDKLWREHRQLPLSAAHKVYKLLSRRGRIPDDTFTQLFYGLQYEGKLNNNVDAAIYFFGAFEKPLLHFVEDSLRALAPTQGVFVDVGANVGQHSLFMSRIAAQVIAFEPYEPVRLRLLHQMKLNGISNIEVHASGLSDRSRTMPFYAPVGSNAGIGSFDPESTKKGNIAIGELAIVSGDAHFEQHKPARLDVLKIDVEGFERSVLQGLKKTLQTYRPLVVCEMTYGNADSFTTSEDIIDSLPENYTLLCFDRRRADGRKRQRDNARARHSGLYRLMPYPGPLVSGQDDVILCPQELLSKLPFSNNKN
jgi:FkbM family methyltransferase